jgi:hypothetical protein
MVPLMFVKCSVCHVDCIFKNLPCASSRILIGCQFLMSSSQKWPFCQERRFAEAVVDEAPFVAAGVI